MLVALLAGLSGYTNGALAWLLDTVAGIADRPVDLSPWGAELVAEAQRARQRVNALLPPIGLQPPTRFEAFVNCPNCGHYACHPLHVPGLRPQPPVRSVDLVDIEVIRTCTQCQHEWGQT
jgi:hypothetical protein